MHAQAIPSTFSHFHPFVLLLLLFLMYMYEIINDWEISFSLHCVLNAYVYLRAYGINVSVCAYRTTTYRESTLEMLCSMYIPYKHRSRRKTQQGNGPNESKTSQVCICKIVCVCVCASVCQWNSGLMAMTVLRQLRWQFAKHQKYMPAYCVLMVCHQCYDI